MNDPRDRPRGMHPLEAMERELHALQRAHERVRVAEMRAREAAFREGVAIGCLMGLVASLLVGMVVYMRYRNIDCQETSMGMNGEDHGEVTFCDTCRGSYEEGHDSVCTTGMLEGLIASSRRTLATIRLGSPSPVHEETRGLLLKRLRVALAYFEQEEASDKAEEERQRRA